MSRLVIKPEEDFGDFTRAAEYDDVGQGDTVQIVEEALNETLVVYELVATSFTVTGS